MSIGFGTSSEGNGIKMGIKEPGGCDSK